MRGVTIIALKRASYFYSAYNLAVSIRSFSPSIPITLLTDNTHHLHYSHQHLSAFDSIVNMNLCDYIDKDGSFQPGLAKISMYKYFQYEENLYVDADSLCLQDITPLLNECSDREGFIYSHVIGTGGYNDDIPYNIWGRNPFQYEFFDIPKENTLNTMNSSWMWIRKCDKAEIIFKEMREYWDKGYGIENLRSKWGKDTYPDELFFNCVLAKHSIDPRINKSVMFFGNEYDKRTFSQLENDYLFLTLYGVGKTSEKNQATVKTKYIEWYDRLCFNMFTRLGLEHHFKSHTIMRGKHINNR